MRKGTSSKASKLDPRLIEEWTGALLEDPTGVLPLVEKAVKAGSDISQVYPMLVEVLSHDDFKVASAAQDILDVASRQDPRALKALVDVLHHAKTPAQKHALSALMSIADRGTDLSLALPDLHSMLDDSAASAIDQVGHSVGRLLATLHAARGEWPQIAPLLVHSSAWIRNGCLQSLKLACAKGIDLWPMILPLVQELGDDAEFNRKHAIDAVTSCLKTRLDRGSSLPDDVDESKLANGSRAMKTLRALVKALQCEICRDLPAELSVNVDDELPPAAKKLVSLVWCQDPRPGWDGYGLSFCPECGAYYYDARELSMTGSGMNDNEYFTRLIEIESEAVWPSLEQARRDKNEEALKDILKRLRHTEP